MLWRIGPFSKGKTMIFSTEKTRYLAQKNNPQCFSFYKVSGGFMCFFCAQSLQNWLNQG